MPNCRQFEYLQIICYTSCRLNRCEVLTQDKCVCPIFKVFLQLNQFNVFGLVRTDFLSAICTNMNKFILTASCPGLHD